MFQTQRYVLISFLSSVVSLFSEMMSYNFRMANNDKVNLAIRKWMESVLQLETEAGAAIRVFDTQHDFSRGFHVEITHLMQFFLVYQFFDNAIGINVPRT